MASPIPLSLSHVDWTLSVGERFELPAVHLSLSLFVIIMLIGTIAAAYFPNFIPRLLETQSQPDTPGVSYLHVLKILVVCSCFMIVGPLLMIINKDILQKLDFDFPLTLSGLGLLTTGIAIQCCVSLGFYEVRDEVKDAISGPDWHKGVVPLAASKAGTFALGNTVYLYLGLGFIQMLKAVNPAIVVAVMLACGLDSPRRLPRRAIYLIITGTLMEVEGELRFSLFGIGVMMASELCEAISLVLSQKYMQVFKFSVTETLYIMALPTVLVIYAAASVIEWPRLLTSGKYMIIVEHPGFFLGSCMLGLAINFVSMAVVSVTSSLTLKVLNTFRGMCVVVVGMTLYNEHVTYVECLGYAVSLVGFCLYQYAQMQEASAKK